jgi:uncharacterized damage-inducible protein DinB
MSAYKKHLKLLATCNTWAWQVMFKSLHNLPANSYSKQCGLWAGSIKGTVQHLLFADYLWYTRHTGVEAINGVTSKSLAPMWNSDQPNLIWATNSVSPIPDLPATERLILEQCQRWSTFIDFQSADALDSEFLYHSTSGQAINKHRGGCIGT